MFTSVDRVERKILEVIYDDADDDLVFLIAQKSTGKTDVLNRLEALLSKDGVLFASGESIKAISNDSVVKRAFAEGIIKYCDKCEEGRQNLLEELQLRGVVTQNLSGNNTRLGTVLCVMSAEDLKTIYSIISNSTPLVLLMPPCPRIKDEDLRFFSELDDSLIEFKPRVTYVVATRSNPTNVERIRKIVQSKGKGVWLFPVFCAEQMIDGQIPSTESNWNILDSIGKAYGKAWTATYLQLLANSEITKEEYDCVVDAISVLGICQPEGYSEKLVLYNNGVYSWIDASSYSAAPKAFGDAAYNDSQNLFFRIVECINQKICKEARTYTEKNAIRNARNAIIRFLKIIANNKPNCILEDFSEY